MRRTDPIGLVVTLPVALAGCLAPGGIRVQTADFPEVTVHCSTTPELAPGECEAWALDLLASNPGRAAESASLVLAGPVGPGPQGRECRAEFRDRLTLLLEVIAIECHVPSGG